MLNVVFNFLLFFHFSWVFCLQKHKLNASQSHWSGQIQKQSSGGVLKKGVLRNFAKFKGKHLCQCLFFNKVAGVCNFIKKESLAQVFSCEFCKISKNTFSYRTPLVAASINHDEICQSKVETKLAELMLSLLPVIHAKQTYATGRLTFTCLLII